MNDTIDDILIKVLGPQICAKLEALATDESLWHSDVETVTKLSNQYPTK